MFIQCAHTHVVLSEEKVFNRLHKTGVKGERETLREHVNEQTDLDGSPPTEGDSPCLVLDIGAPAVPDEARQLERFYVVKRMLYHFLRLRHWLRNGVDLHVVELVKVHFSHGRLKQALRIPREGDVDLVHGFGCQRRAILDEGGVRWVCLGGGGVRV